MSFSRLATSTASTKRSTISGGKFGTPAAYLSGLSCLPVMPVSPEVAATLNVEVPYELMETYIDGNIDIVEGDLMTVDGVEYRVRAVGDWPFAYSSTAYKAIILEEYKE